MKHILSDNERLREVKQERSFCNKLLTLICFTAEELLCKCAVRVPPEATDNYDLCSFPLFLLAYYLLFKEYFDSLHR